MNDATWAYGVTTVPSRASTLLPQTLVSLAEAGFSKPRLFVDGYVRREEYVGYGLEVTHRDTTIGVTGNWYLALTELYVRHPFSERYAIFQDDILMCRNVRSYLDSKKLPEDGYLNLMTFMDNERVVENMQPGWYEARWLNDSHKLQSGRSAVALVFPRKAVTELLSSASLVERFRDKIWGGIKIDGAVVEVMNKAGWVEYVHNPSLVQHAGDISAIRNPQYVGMMRASGYTNDIKRKTHPKALTFPGQQYDAMELLCSATR